MNKSKILEEVIKNLKKIYKIAIINKNLTLALQTQKAIAQVLMKNDNKNDEEISLNKLTTAQIQKLIKESEQNDSKNNQN